jgi:glycosyltransferase involved in cell wall biosynthesis
MRIAMVGNGATVHAALRAGALAARGHAVRLVTLGPVVLNEGIEVRTRPIPASLLGAFIAARSFLRDIRDFKPELLHVHYAGGRLGTLASLSNTRPLAVTVMGGDVQPEQHLGGYSWLERRATRRLLQEADLVLVKSDSLRSAMRSYGRFKAPIETVAWGVDLNRVRRSPKAAAALRARLNLSSKQRVLVSPRILRPLYNIHLIVEAMPFVSAAVDDVVLLITEHRPDEDYRRRLVARVRELDIESNVRFVGALPYTEIPALMSLADVVVSVPLSDGLPQSLFEAMACGAPVVVGRLPAYGELIEEGEHALMTELRPEAIAAAVVRLLGDSDFATRLTRTALTRVRERADIAESARRVEAFYQRALNQPRRRSLIPSLARLIDGLSLLVR